jgi:O-antigen/teichoic acid export membrane protein
MKKALVLVFTSNAVSMFLRGLAVLLLPRFLSIESFGYLKTFQFYAGYLFVLSLGVAEGVYIRYGGKGREEIDHNELSGLIGTFRNLQIVISVTGAAVGIALDSWMVTLVFGGIAPISMLGLFRALYQAIGDFKRYSRTVSGYAAVIFFMHAALLFLFRIEAPIFYAGAIVLCNLILWIWLEADFYRLFGVFGLFAMRLRVLITYARAGIILLVGTGASALLTSVDRLFIKLWMRIQEFSFYSLAVSVMNIFYACVSPVAIVLYQAFCRNREGVRVVRLYKMSVVLALGVAEATFLVKVVILYWIPEYRGAISVLFLLMCSNIVYFVVNAIYVNLFKASNRQGTYLLLLIVCLAVTITASVVLFQLWPFMESFAAGTCIGAGAWLIMCRGQFKSVKTSGGEVLLSFGLFVFVVCGLVLPVWIGSVAYPVLVLGFLLVAERTLVREIQGTIIGGLKRLFGGVGG